jgi:catechol-2,3-dioxygenase
MVANIGGVFLYSENPKQLAEWYKNALDVRFESAPGDKVFYISYPYREADTEKTTYTVFSIMHREKRPRPEHRLFTLNLRVHNLEKLAEHLKNHNIVFKGIETHPEGKFGWIEDAEGNYIELWEDTKADAS